IWVNSANSGVSISGNVLKSPTDVFPAVIIRSGSGASIVSNTINDYRFGILVDGASGTQISQNTIAVQTASITLLTADNTVSGNTCSEVAAGFIGVVRLAGAGAQRNTVRQNVLTSSAAGSPAILLEAGADYNQLLGNSLRSGAIVVQSSAGPHNVVAGN